MSRAKPRFKRVNPPLPALTNNIFLVSVLGVIENQLTINTFAYEDNKAVGAPAGNPEAELGAAWRVNVLGSYRACCSADWSVTGIKTSCINLPTRIPVFDTGAYPLAGTGATGHFPTEVSAVIQRKTVYKGQSGRGRFSLPALPLSAATASALTAGQIATQNTFLTALAGTLTTVNNVFSPALVSRRGVFPNFTYGSALLTAFINNTVLGTVRRRKIGRGR